MKYVSAALGAVVFSLCALAQQPLASAMQPNTIYVGAEGRYEAAPDTAVVQFNIAAQEDAAKAAYARASAAAEQVRAILRNNGIEPKAAEIGFFSLAPVYDYRTPKRKLVAYRVSSSVSLRLKGNDFSKVAAITEQLSAIDVTENQNISYTLDNIDAAKLHAVQDAFQRARAEAETLARAGSRTLGELSYGSIDTFEAVPVVSPFARHAMAAGTLGKFAAPEPPPPTAEFSPQHIVVTARVNALFALR